MGLGDKAAALALAERAMAANPDRERRLDWSRSDRDSCPGSGADGRARPRHRRFTETTLDTVRGPAGFKPAAHSCAAPARSDVRSASERSALPKTLRGKEAVNARNFFTASETSANVYKFVVSFVPCGETSRLFEIARVLVRLDHVARIIVNANHSTM